MAKQIEGVYERILACAKKEFLQMGFAEASLRVIASEAQTTIDLHEIRRQAGAVRGDCRDGGGRNAENVPCHAGGV